MTERSAASGVGAIGLAVALSLGAACSRTPELAAEHLRRGDAAMTEGRYSAALSAYTHARELAPTDAAVQRAMMRARVHLVAESPARLGADAVEDARYEAKLLLDTDPPRAPVYLTALANLLYRQGDVEGAKRKLAEALQRDPGSALAHTALGTLLMSRKEGAEQAKIELEAALASKPDDTAALLALGQLELARGDVVAAVGRLEAALRGGEDFAARMALGKARERQQKPAEAVEQFQRAAQLDPGSAEALGALGQALLDAGRADEAERALRAAIRLAQEPATQIALGFALVRQRKLDPALALFAEMLKEDANAAGALFGAGLATEELGRKEESLAFYRRLLALPQGGREGQMLVDIQRDARSRVAALSAASTTSAGAAASKPPPAR